MSRISGGKAFWGGIAPTEVRSSAPLRSTEFLQSALAGSRVGTWQVDMRSGMVTWDAETSRIFELDLVGTGALLPVHPDDQASLWESIERNHRTGELHDMVFRALRPDGETRWLQGRGCAYPADVPGSPYMAGTIIDITERKETEEAGAERERQLRSIVENLPGVIYRCGLEPPWRMTFVSEAVAELTGRPAADFLSGQLTFEDIIVPEDRGKCAERVAASLAEHSQYDFRYRIVHSSGEIRWVHERGRAVCSADGEPLFLEGFIGDCNEQEAAERKLRETEERLRLAAQATQDAVWDWDLVTNELIWDAVAGDSIGYPAEELGDHIDWWRSRVHPDDHPAVKFELERVIGGATDRLEVDYRFLRADGSYADILDRGFLIRDEHGRPRRLVGAMHDHTARNASNRLGRQRESRLQKVFEQALVGIMEVGSHGGILMANARFCEILGRSEEELKTTSLADFTHPDDLSWNVSLLQKHTESGEPFQLKKRYVRPDGEVVWCNVSVSFVHDDVGKVESTIVLAQDITRTMAATEALRENEMLYRSVLDASADCIKIIGLDGRLEFMNEPGVRIIELDNATDVVGRPLAELWPESGRDMIAMALASACAGESVRSSGYCPTAKGTPKWWDLSVTPMRDEEGEVVRILVISRDITAQRGTAERLRWASEHDALTGLPNRRAFETHLQAATIRAMQGQRNVGLLLLDLDHFKHVNDTLGHAAGDHLLTVFGKRLMASVRGGDFVARLGGDEFAIICEDEDKELDLIGAGGSILARLHEPIEFEGRVMSASASIGGALFPQDGASANDLLKNADIALYALKESGRGGTRMFHQHMRQEAQLVASQLSLARTAVNKKSVEPHYQQKVDLGTGRIAGFEALLRWRHARTGIQHPDTVAEAFKDYELASKIGDLMQRGVFSDLRGWLDQGLPIGTIAVNASPAEFLRDDFAERLLARMEDVAIPPHLIEVEVTEHVFLDRGSDFVGRALKLLAGKGVRIALDDFGTGYSSLSHLRDYPVNVVKIDRSFIDRIETDSEIRAIVCAVIDLAKSLNIEVVAEGVENIGQKRVLIDEGCLIGQGFLFGRAIEAEKVPLLFGRPLKHLCAA